VLVIRHSPAATAAAVTLCDAPPGANAQLWDVMVQTFGLIIVMLTIKTDDEKNMGTTLRFSAECS